MLTALCYALDASETKHAAEYATAIPPYSSKMPALKLALPEKTPCIVGGMGKLRPRQQLD